MLFVVYHHHKEGIERWGRGLFFPLVRDTGTHYLADWFLFGLEKFESWMNFEVAHHDFLPHVQLAYIHVYVRRDDICWAQKLYGSLYGVQWRSYTSNMTAKFINYLSFLKQIKACYQIKAFLLKYQWDWNTIWSSLVSSSTQLKTAAAQYQNFMKFECAVTEKFSTEHRWSVSCADILVATVRK